MENIKNFSNLSRIITKRSIADMVDCLDRHGYKSDVLSAVTLLHTVLLAFAELSLLHNCDHCYSEVAEAIMLGEHICPELNDLIDDARVYLLEV